MKERQKLNIHHCLGSKVNIVRIYGLKQEGGELFIRDFRKLLKV